jgi:hypothetical protein
VAKFETISNDQIPNVVDKSKFDELVKSPKGPFPVIPAQAGIQSFSVLGIPLDSRFHGNDDFLRNHQV